MNDAYRQTLQYLYDSTPAFHLVGGEAYKPGLQNTERLMEALGHPHRAYRTIHIAGTNGKGSTSHLIAAVLQRAGYRVGLYTSPHLVDFSERIRVDGQPVDHRYVVDFVAQHRALLDDVRPSFFETAMSMAFCYFRDRSVDVAVVEVGLGGRLDSTNIISPVLSVITNIGMDHTEFLGNTLELIAAEKAGIIKPHTPVVIGETQAETAPVFTAQARALHAPIVFADRQLLLGADYDCQLHGDYQQHNKQTALTAIIRLRGLGFNISEDAVREGFASVCTLTGLQGRWQVVEQQPLTICDTGHNSHGLAYVARQLQHLREERSCRLHIVFGMVADKDIDQVLPLLPAEAAYYFAAPDSHRALPAGEMQQMAAACGLHGAAYPSAIEAYTAARTAATPGDILFFGGSNYLVGQLLAHITEKRISVRS